MQNHEWHPRRPKDELVYLMSLTCEEFGLLQRFRDYAWTNGGIPAEETLLEKLARAWHVSRYKFKRLWERLRNFFTETDGYLYYTRDEDERRAQVVVISKAQESGRLGAERRWAKKVSTQQDFGEVPDRPPILNDGVHNGVPIANHSRQLQTEETPPPPPTPSEYPVGGGGGSSAFEPQPLPPPNTRLVVGVDRPPLNRNPMKRKP